MTWNDLLKPVETKNNHVPFNPGFPVFVYDEGLELPKDGTYFVVAGNGCFLHKDTGLVSCFVPVNQISILQEIQADTWVHCKLPPIPQCFVYRVKKFFAQVVEEYRTEANVIVYFNKQSGEYRIFPSEQSVSHGGVHYKRKGVTAMENMDGFLRVGTIHSHCDFQAFHSGTDVNDEGDFDGLHITFGHNDDDEFDISASFAVNNQRLKVDPMTVLTGIQPTKGNLYGLVESTPEQQNEWLAGMDAWMATIERPKFFGLAGGKRLSVRKGDKVTWADPAKNEKWCGMFGKGPFDVEINEGEKIVINTPVGMVRFSYKVFKSCDPPKSEKDREVEKMLADLNPEEIPVQAVIVQECQPPQLPEPTPLSQEVKEVLNREPS